MRNNDLRTELEYFSKDYDKEREMEPRPEPVRAATTPLRPASPRVHRRRERVVGFEETQNRVESRVERNNEGGRPSEEASRGNRSQNVNLPPLLAAHIGRSENGQPLSPSRLQGTNGKNVHLGRSKRGGQVIEETVLKEQRNPPRTTTEDRKTKTEEITFPPVTRVSNAPVIIEVAVFGRKVGRVYMDSGSTCENSHAENGDRGLNNSRGHKVSHQKRVRTILLVGAAMVGEAGEETKKARRTLTINKERIPSCDDTEEKIVMNDKYHE
ncbi:hypothetical protein Tco_1140760 [Tanacetum coccineum]